MSDKSQPDEGVAPRVRDDVSDRHADGIPVAVPQSTVKKAATQTGQSAETPKEK